jgi:glucose/arabinose dehydrogenase
VRARAAVPALVAAALAAAAPAHGKLLAHARFPAAMAPLRGGGLVYGELTTGRIWKLSKRGHRSKHPIARIRHVSHEGLRGLLGLAVDKHGRVFADWTGTDGVIHVAKVAPGRQRAVWSPGSDGEEANGGRLAFGPDGRLIVSVGDRDRSVQPGPTGPIGPAFPGFSGGIYSVDPNRGPSQTARLLAGGFFNPFGLAVTPSGDIWATDNAITPDTDLIARVHDGTAQPFAYMAHTAPSGLAAIDDGTLAVCGFVSQRLDRFLIAADGTAHVAPPPAPPIATGCELGVIRLSDGRLAYASRSKISVVSP